MNSSKKLPLLLGVGIILLGISRLSAQEGPGSVSVLFVKNNTNAAILVWVNGAYQGLVVPGATSYALAEGFVTPDSGFQKNGSLKQAYSHGGWELRAPYKVHLSQTQGRLPLPSADVIVTGDVEHRAFVWLGEKDAGKEIDALDMENAGKITPSGANYDIKPSVNTLVAKTKGQKRQDKVVGVWYGESWRKDNPSAGFSNRLMYVYTFNENGTMKSVLRDEYLDGSGVTDENPRDSTWTSTDLGIVVDSNATNPWKIEDGVLVDSGGTRYYRKKRDSGRVVTN